MMPTLPNALPFMTAPEGGVKLAPEGAVEGDLFTQLLTQLGGIEGGELAAPQPAAPDASLQNLQQLVLKSLPVAKAQAQLEPSKEPATAEPAEASVSDHAAEPELPPILAMLTAPIPSVQVQPPVQPVKVTASALSAVPTAPATAIVSAPIVTGSSAPLAAPPAETPAPSPEQAVAEAVAIPLQPKANGEPVQSERAVLPAIFRDAAQRPAGSAAPAIETRLPDLATDTSPALQASLPSIAPATAPAVVAQPSPVEPAQASETQPVIERQLDLAHEAEWLDQLAKDIVRSGGEDGRLRFNLRPEHLGALQVELSQTASGGTSVRLIADNDAARAIIADAQPRLVAEARAQGLRIAETHVDLGSGGQSGDPRGQRGQQEETVRTFRLSQAEMPAAPEPVPGTSERYA